MMSLLLQQTPEKRIHMTKPIEGVNLQLDVDLQNDYADLKQTSSVKKLDYKLQSDQKAIE